MGNLADIKTGRRLDELIKRAGSVVSVVGVLERCMRRCRSSLTTLNTPSMKPWQVRGAQRREERRTESLLRSDGGTFEFPRED